MILSKIPIFGVTFIFLQFLLGKDAREAVNWAKSNDSSNLNNKINKPHTIRGSTSDDPIATNAPIHSSPTTKNNQTRPILPAGTTTSEPAAAAIQEDSRHERKKNITTHHHQEEKPPSSLPIIIDEKLTIDTPPQASSDPASQEAPEVSHDLSTQKQLPIEQNSTISSDVLKIWHDTDSKEVCVAFQQDARCPHPSLLGRLSGPGLAILEWKERQSTEGTVLCGGYSHNWLEAGDYFVEIIILYCNDFGVNALARYNDTTAWMQFKPANSCVEHVMRNRITAKDEKSMIHIPTSTEGRGSYRLGRWIRKPGIPSRPLYTRSQPKECVGAVLGQEPIQKDSPLDKYCTDLTERDNNGRKMGKNVAGLYEYEFQWWHKRSEEELIEKLRHRLRNNMTASPKVCAVGDSHSQYITKYTLPQLKLTHLFDYVKNPWPKARVGRWKERMKTHKCDTAFIQSSQWPSSYQTGRKPFPYAEYHAKLKEHVQSILIANPNATVYLPTADQCPLMGRVATCEDWRAPTLIDGYSHVHQMIVNELNTSQVKYLDTNFIIYTHWDGHTDWQHLMRIVRKYKTLYFAAVMFGETEYTNRL